MTIQYSKVLVLSLLWVLLFNCSSATSDSTANGKDSLDFASIGSNVTTLNLVGSTTTLKFDNPSDDEDYVMVIYTTQNQTAEAGFSLSTGVPTDDVETGFQVAETNTTEHDFHELLRAYEQTLDAQKKILSTGFQVENADEMAVGDTDSFTVLSSLDDLEETTHVHATLLYQTESFNFFVDNTALNSMSEENVEELCENFANVIDDMHANFGHESDINGDGRFDILATPVVNQLSASTDSFTTGFFFARDLYATQGSNQREIFYTVVPDPEGEFGTVLTEEFAFSNILPTTLPHEFQHMINHNERVLELGAESEDQWLNEALSHLAEDIYSMDAEGYMTTTGIENPSRVDLYLENVADVCFVCETDLAARGGAYLFLRSLYESAENGEFSTVESGRELLQGLVQNNRLGEDNISHAVFGEEAAEGDFAELVGQFALMMHFNLIEGIDLQAYQYDNRHTNLHGVNVLELSNESLNMTLSGQSVMYIEIKGENLVANDGEVVLNHETGRFAGFLIGS